MNQYCTPENVVRLLKEGNPHEVNQATTCLYRMYKQKVASYIFQQGGSYQDAKDIFQDVIITFLHLVQENKFVAKSEKEMDGFFMTIARNKWLKKKESDERRYKREDLSLIQNEGIRQDTPLENLLWHEEQSKAISIFNKLDDLCQKILLAFYIDKLSLEEIAIKFNLASEGAAKVKKFRCLKALRSLL
jgi:RNA polymerase sigma factor (sigma-70 family)